MKKEDIIEISMEAREALRVYALLCKANGGSRLGLFRELKAMFDPDFRLYKLNIDSSLPYVDYNLIRRELEAAVFNKKTESELQLEQVMSKLSELQLEAQRLQEIVAKESK